jgi:hypothetical protein
MIPCPMYNLGKRVWLVQQLAARRRMETNTRGVAACRLWAALFQVYRKMLP